MREYTYDELQQMQEKALERVRNMQMYSKNAVEGTNAQGATGGAQSNAPQPNAPPSPPHKSGRIKMPLNLPEERDLVYPSFKEHFAPETQKAKQQTEQKNKANLLDTVLKEPDEAILCSLLLLLKSEGTDEALMMALLYIMS